MAAEDGQAGDGVSGDGEPGGDSAGDGGRPCPACGRPMYRRHCKYVCPAHGVVFDCADTFY